jgi:hypothetical protein
MSELDNRKKRLVKALKEAFNDSMYQVCNGCKFDDHKRWDDPCNKCIDLSIDLSFKAFEK